MDSTDAEQEPADQQADSPDDGQEDARSGIDNSGDRLNGLMRLVGKRTTEVSQQKARAEQAEAALADMTQRLAAYEDGASMSDADALEAETQQGASQDDGNPTDEPDQSPAPGFDYWGGEWVSPDGHPAAATRVDPNSVSRDRSMRSRSLSDAERLQADFDAGLDQALTTWGIDG